MISTAYDKCRKEILPALEENEAAAREHVHTPGKEPSAA